MLQTKTVAQLMAVPKPPMLVEGMLIEKGLHMYQSHSGTGKTFLCLELGIAVATGMPALGKFQVPNHGKVLYLGEDSPEWDVREQFKKLCNEKGFGIENFDLPWEYDSGGEVIPESGPQFEFCINTGAHLNNDKAIDEIVNTIEAKGFKLVIIDTLSAFNEGNENDAGWMALIMKRLKRIRESAAIILLHHTIKASEFERSGTTGARGSSAIGASMDGALALTRKKDGSIAARITKQRAVRMTEFDYFLVFDDDTAKLTLIEDSDPILQALTAALEKSGPKGMGRLDMLPIVKGVLGAKATGPEVETAWWRAMQKLMRDGVAMKIKRGVYRKV